MKPALFGLLVFAITTGLVFGGYGLGYNDAKQDVAERWWDDCRTQARSVEFSDVEAVRVCGEAMPRELGLENKWNLR